MDKYVKVRKIGEGAFGKADLVKLKNDGSQCVIKEISIMRMNSKERSEARKEVSVLAQLKHPNIVAYRESFEEHGCLYIVMDFCSGGDMYAKINNQRGIMFGEDQILDWFVQMCLAIKHIHDRKILHRDIKSQNIFLTSKGMVQLGDFGIAKVLNSTVELARTCIGTPYYLSPEICENKPYNNKSDIWSLGCVVYELATLKHAFEAGNMKNLVLKIIRGSYPPLSPKYSYELRNLIAQLFKRSPRDRPSINSVLKKPIISQRVPKFLTTDQLEAEFSHTVMHGQKLGRALPPPPNQAARPPSAARNRPEVGGPAVAAAAKRYDPSRIYGAPVVRKSKENRAPADVKKRPGSAGSRPGSAAGSRPGSAAGSRPGSAAGSRPSSSQDLQRKKQDLMEKERRRREEIRKREEDQKRKEYEKRHKDLIEKQRLARIHRSREEGWNNVLSSLDSDRSGKDEKDQVRPAVPAPAPAPRPVGGPGGDYNANVGQQRGKYEHYNDYLDKLQKDRDVRQRQEGVPAKAPAASYMGAPRPLPGAPKPAPVWRRAPETPQPTPMYAPHNQRAQNQVEERARLVDDFINRKKEAAMNKNRGQAQMFGPSQAQQRRPPSANRGSNDQPQQQRPPSAASSRNREEQEYLDKLRQIRQQNYNERRNIQAKVAADKNPDAAEERKKKAEALKKQAEDWAKQRASVLEKKKQELFEQQRQLREVRQRPGVPVKPSPAVPMTGAMNAIGATPRVVPAASPAPPGPAMTNVLGAIGVTPKVVQEEDDRARTPIQKQKDEILKKLNQKGPPGETEEAKESARSKWGAGGDIKLAEAVEEPESSRSQWGGAPSLDLGKLTLEETASQMEVTSARDKVIVNPESARRQWGRPGATVINALQGVPLAEQTMASDKSGRCFTEEVVSSASSTSESPVTPAIGATITISKSVKKGTITIRTADQNEAVAESTNQNTPPLLPSEAAPSNLSPVLETRRETSSSPVKEKTSPRESPVKQTESPSKESIKDALPNEESKPGQTEDKSEVKEETQQEETSQSEKVVQQKPPLPDRKPPVGEKPIVLPKPVLLPKPDKPMQFGQGVPVSVKSEGAGSLFERVELEDDTEENKQKTTKVEKEEDNITVKEYSDSEKPKSGLLLGITMGSFDIGHRELLRTCSEPDLASLFRTLNAETPNVRVKSLDDMSTVNEEDDYDMEDVCSSMEKAVENADNEKSLEEKDKEGKQENVEKNDEQPNDEDQEDFDDEEDEDLADLMSVRETMQSLLIDDSEDDVKKSPVKFSMSSDRESRGDTNDGDVDDTEEDNMDGKSEDEEKDEEGGEEGEENEGDEQGSDDEDVDDESNKEENNDGENQDDEDSDVRRSHSVDNENPQTPDESADDFMSEILGEDDSDSEFDDGEEAGDFDLFGRLEESRAQLEEELGAEKLIKVYKTVQALQEDEDENMEEGARIAQDLLGEQKVHLYPKIFQLVMADAAFTDDNLS